MIINFLQHTLTTAQLEELGNEEEIVHLREMDNALYERVANSPSEEGELELLANTILNGIHRILKNLKLDNVTLLMPGGSPALNALLMYNLGFNRNADTFETYPLVTLLFAHTERCVREITLPDGSVKKEAIFKHNKFLRFRNK